MSRFLGRLREIPANVRLIALVVFGLLVAGVWFFFLRSDSPISPITPPSRPAVGKVITLAEYESAVQDALTDIQDARAASGSDRDASISRAITALSNVEGAAVTASPSITVTLAEIDNTLVLRELDMDEPNLEAVETSLTLLSGSLSDGPAGHLGPVEGTRSGEQATQALAEIMSSPIYDYNRSASPLQKLAEWLANLTGSNDPDGALTRLLLAILAGLAVASIIFVSLQKWVPNKWARLGISVLGGIIAGVLFYVGTDHLDLVFQILTAVGLGVVAVVVALLIAGLNRGSTPGSVRTVSDLASVLGMSAAEARQKAIDAAAAADYRSAIRYRCLAVLLALDEAGMLVFDRTATNREYLFKAPGPLHTDLQLLLSRFEAIWYGNSPTNAEEYAQYTAKAAQIEAQITPATKQKAA